MRLLLAWFTRNPRNLPWRHSLDPYAVWISEIMLQQTQVNTVVPYFERWIAALPTVQDLATASPERVLKLWEGLGYYTRARAIQKAARQILEDHDGQFPTAYSEVLALPGVGPYTAGAICSIAFNQPTPIVDGNVIRVLARIFGIAGNPKAGSTRTRFWALAESIVSVASTLPPVRVSAQCRVRLAGNCSAINQALMEFGALVCTPRQPHCTECPARRLCFAWTKGAVQELPTPAERAPATNRHDIAWVLEHRGRFLVRQRPAGGVNAHLWEFPNRACGGGKADPLQAGQRHLGTRMKDLQPMLVVRHSITRYRIHLVAYHTRCPERPSGPECAGRWFRLEELKSLAFTSAHRRIVERLAKLAAATRVEGKPGAP